MNTSIFIEFTSRTCKESDHAQCHGRWTGLGFIATCYCLCHRQKQALAESVGSEANAIGQSLEEISHNDQ